jgi:hypothetical protein
MRVMSEGNGELMSEGNGELIIKRKSVTDKIF